MSMQTIRLSLERLGAIGDKPEDGQQVCEAHRLLVYMGVSMGTGALVLGTIASAFELFWSGVIPYAFSVVTLVNMMYFRHSKNFEVVRFVQLLSTMAMPFLFQWSIGGFELSGAVMLWALPCIMGALTVDTPRRALSWFGVYVVLILLSALVDDRARAAFPLHMPDGLQVMFFVLNVTMTSFVVFGMAYTALVERNQAIAQLGAANLMIQAITSFQQSAVEPADSAPAEP